VLKQKIKIKHLVAFLGHFGRSEQAVTILYWYGEQRPSLPLAAYDAGNPETRP
jgi:hypothetical protein